MVNFQGRRGGTLETEQQSEHTVVGIIQSPREDLAGVDDDNCVAPRWLQEGLAKLGSEERTCLLLREQAGLSVSEVADIMGLAPEQASLALFAAREQLRLCHREHRSVECPAVEQRTREPKLERKASAQAKGSEIRQAKREGRKTALPMLVFLAIIFLSPVLYDLALWLQEMFAAH